MTLYTKRTPTAALRYHETQRRDLIAEAWLFWEEDLQDTRAYAELQRDIARHERLIAALMRWGMGL